jgi:cation diffusion facilitator CzcD-associated flavoprotein CzcO
MTTATARVANAPAGADEPTTRVRVLIVGAGFAGLCAGIRLRERGITDVVIVERGDDVGGTWRDNTYPGAACDVPSHLYSFSFAPNPDWSRTFSPQPEIQAYLRRCADRFGITPTVRLREEVLGASWDDERQRWHVRTTRGRYEAEVLIGAMGALSEPALPQVPGIERFRGTVFHSARWDHGHELAGERVAVVGTGASAIQFVPQIVDRVEHLDLYQRTPPWIIPRTDRAISRAERWLYRHVPALQRLVRSWIYWSREAYVLGFTGPRWLMRLPDRIARWQLRRQVDDPALRATLTPDYTIGCKRILISNDYYPALTRDHVDVIPHGIREVTETGIVDAEGVERPADTIIFGTGFRVTDLPVADRIRGRDGLLLRDAWRDGMSAHRGTAVAGFPNLFFIVGPNTGLGHSSMVLMMEAQVTYVLDALALMERRNLGVLEVTEEAQAASNADLQARMRGTVWVHGGCASWYLDAAGRNTTLYPDFTFRFAEETRRLDVAAYRTEPRRTPAVAPAEAA